MPTKPTTPATATAAPTAAAVVKTIRRLTRSTSTPRWKASASPSSRPLRARVSDGSAKATISANGATASTLGQLAPDRLPSIHSVRSRSSRSSLAKAMRPVSALAKAPSAMPASSSVLVASWPWRGHQQHQRGGGGKAAAEGGDGQRVDAERLDPRRGKAVAQRDGGHCRQRRAGGDADQPGIGERIAEHALHHRAGDGERGAHECAEQQARQADVDQHELLAGGRGVGVAAGEAADHAGQGGERDARRADRERQESGEREGQRRSRHQLAGATHARRVASRTSRSSRPPSSRCGPRRRRQGRDRAGP